MTKLVISLPGRRQALVRTTGCYHPTIYPTSSVITTTTTTTTSQQVPEVAAEVLVHALSRSSQITRHPVSHAHPRHAAHCLTPTRPPLHSYMLSVSIGSQYNHLVSLCPPPCSRGTTGRAGGKEAEVGRDGGCGERKKV
ncbi:hypothetical protein E2C01_035694 [Portunus trituberculatus]|uniref:Uncharacterized protein n=1 Tax=Portunus trituberculatus TaxID=210409 RepID=A0A5B7F3U4_PORTR|nr:hypothetical protein [Portunus trituberculatus]